MQIEIVRKGKVLQQVVHNGQSYLVAPKEGAYVIRLRNTGFTRQMAVVSVDGVNVIDGTVAGFNGTGYVVGALQTMDIPGWRRSDQKVAKFEFTPQEGSYAAQTGRGTSNVGVIGVAVFEEKPKYTFTLHNGNGFLGSRLQKGEIYGSAYSSHTVDWSNNTSTYTATRRGGDLKGGNVLRSRSMKSMDSDQTLCCDTDEGSPAATTASVNMVQVGTGYGHESTFQTEDTEFTKLSDIPSSVLTLRYATREMLQSWGIRVDPIVAAPNAFPAQACVPAPPGWGR